MKMSIMIFCVEAVWVLISQEHPHRNDKLGSQTHGNVIYL
jgi:hypothetical protein